MIWNQSMVERFWWFVAERHRIFIKRVVLRLDPPWTLDPILARARFTNVYRELDRTTVELFRSIPLGADPEDILFNVIKFRFFTLTDTYRALGGFLPVDAWDPADALRLLMKRQRAGTPNFTVAFTVNATTAAKKYRGFGGKTRLVVHRITRARRRLAPLASEVFGGHSLDPVPTMESAHAAVARRIDGFGGFMSYEVLIDLTYHPGLVPFGRDEWVYVGPGARRGLLALLRKGASLRGEEWAQAIKHLRDIQEIPLGEEGHLGPRLTLEDVEQSLCEFQKYQRIAHDPGRRIKRPYDPIRGGTPNIELWHQVPGLLDRYYVKEAAF